MNKKKKQLNNLISLHDDEYKALNVELINTMTEYHNSINLIERIKLDIDRYNDELTLSMINDTESYVRNYRNVKDYIIYLHDKVSNEVERRNVILNNINILEDNCESLKIKMKGYALLIEQHDLEFKAKTIRDENNENDDMWLLKGTNHD